ncbi:hypothetical protein JTE90_017223 [Oedothorax gibbosus]|uniref:Uncharacterized protein n=1 Tax=Oedothorax gibbosus TaxID=931172 RepID=A0AAV6VFG8_9ARAC|nr:hypothetical protein JTE90_017223 [Oedothorax gibbosus]
MVCQRVFPISQNPSIFKLIFYDIFQMSQIISKFSGKLRLFSRQRRRNPGKRMSIRSSVLLCLVIKKFRSNNVIM